MNLKIGDAVIVIAGKDKNKKGKILAISKDRERVTVEGVNIATMHIKPGANNQAGEIVKKEKPIHCSNVMLVDPKTGERTKIKHDFDKKGSKVRVSKKSGQVIK